MLNLNDALRSRILIVALCLISTVASAAVPDWVRTAAAASLPQYEPDTNAVVLLDEITYNVLGPEDCVEHYRRAVKILRPDGRDEADFSLYFRQKERMSFLRAWSIDKSGGEYEL